MELTLTVTPWIQSPLGTHLLLDHLLSLFHCLTSQVPSSSTPADLWRFPISWRFLLLSAELTFSSLSPESSRLLQPAHSIFLPPCVVQCQILGQSNKKSSLVLFLGFWTLIETRNMVDRCHYKKLACPILSWSTQSLGDPHSACLSSLFYLLYQVFPTFMTFLSLLHQTFFLASARRHEYCSLLPLIFQNSLLQHVFF